MSLKGVRSLNVRVYVHATESREKVLKAVSHIFPGSIGDELIQTIEVYEGYYGNPIEVVTIELEEPRAALEVLRYIVDKLDDFDKRRLRDTLEERVDKHGGLYLRLSKQEAFTGSITLEEGDDVIRVHVRFNGGRREALRYYLDLLS